MMLDHTEELAQDNGTQQTAQNASGKKKEGVQHTLTGFSKDDENSQDVKESWKKDNLNGDKKKKNKKRKNKKKKQEEQSS